VVRLLVRREVSPRLRVWAPALKDDEKQKRGLPANRSALDVRWINTATAGGKSAHDAGLRHGDLIVQLDGKPFQLTNNQFKAHLKLYYKIGKKLPITILRKGREIDLEILLVE